MRGLTALLLGLAILGTVPAWALTGREIIDTAQQKNGLSTWKDRRLAATMRTYNGDFSTDLPLQGNQEEMHRGKKVTLTLGKGSADVNLESFGGEIRVKKASATRSRGRQ